MKSQQKEDKILKGRLIFLNLLQETTIKEKVTTKWNWPGGMQNKIYNSIAPSID